MGKGNRSRNNRKRKARHSSGLQDHRRSKKVLTPPLLTLPNLRQTSWQHDSLPDFIWLQGLSFETGTLAAAHDVLDVLDEFVPTTPAAEGGSSVADPDPASAHVDSVLDGRISTFALVPEERRPHARQALLERAQWALYDVMGHALALYPDCPAAWLYDDWRTANHANPEIGLAFLKRVVVEILDPRGRSSSQLRMLPLARLVKHGRMFFAQGIETVDLLPRYPHDLTDDEQRRVEGFARASWNAQALSGDRRVAEAWAKYFWRHSWQISACEPEPGDLPIVDDEDEDEIDATSRERSTPQEPTLHEVRAHFVAAIDAFGVELRKLQERLDLDLYDPTADEVKLGLASRVFRLLRHLVADPNLWTSEMGPHVLRSVIDARIVIAWMLQQDDPSIYSKFKEYGMGKRKLFKLQLEELMDREDLTDETNSELHRRLEAEVNQEVMEEFIRIDVGGSFSGKSIREMAIETDLADLYRLTYQPLSAETHGEWGSLIAFDLRHCGNPLHRYHRLGTFTTGGETIVHFGWVGNGLMLAEDALTDLFDSYGVDIRPAFETLMTRMSEARQAAPGTDNSE